MDNNLYEKLEFEAVAQSTGYFTELEKFGRRPGTTQFTVGGHEAAPAGRALEAIPEDQEESSGSVLYPEKHKEKDKSAEATEDDESE